MKALTIFAAAAFIAGAAMLNGAESKDSRVYEMRIYYAAKGKLDDLNKRFREHTLKLFEKHGIENIGYWVPLDNTENKLVYVLAHKSRAEADKSWKAFSADAAWNTARKASEANGKLVDRVERYFLQATDYSPEIKVSKTGDRVFELRDYTASQGNLAALDARFRDHTLKLFEKHGMQNIAYWHLEPKEKNADRKLIYLLAHKSKEAGEASFDAFRKDPDWIKVKEDSEKKAGGSLTEGGQAGVKSTYMRAVDYSPTQ
jgi:hypothetical protein